MGWGGSRVGSGKKPKSKPFSIVGRTEPVSSDAGVAPYAADGGLTVAPSDLTPDQQAFWVTHAPLAIERGTLTPATVPAFRLLCELHAKKVMVGTMVDKGALGGLRIFLQLAKQVETLMARFCLAPFGKSIKSEKPKKSENPWAALGKRG